MSGDIVAGKASANLGNTLLVKALGDVDQLLASVTATAWEPVHGTGCAGISFPTIDFKTCSIPLQTRNLVYRVWGRGVARTCSRNKHTVPYIGRFRMRSRRLKSPVGSEATTGRTDLQVEVKRASKR